MSGQTIECPAGYVPAEWPGRGLIFAPERSEVDLGEGLTGYWMGVGGACLQAAVATVLQRPLEAIPDHLDDASSLMVWADQNGLQITFRSAGAGPRPVGLWIGVTFPRWTKGSTARHTVVLRDGRLFFDPAQGFLWPRNGRLLPPAPVAAQHIEHVIHLAPKGS